MQKDSDDDVAIGGRDAPAGSSCDDVGPDQPTEEQLQDEADVESSARSSDVPTGAVGRDKHTASSSRHSEAEADLDAKRLDQEGIDWADGDAGDGSWGEENVLDEDWVDGDGGDEEEATRDEVNGGSAAPALEASAESAHLPHEQAKEGGHVDTSQLASMTGAHPTSHNEVWDGIVNDREEQGVLAVETPEQTQKETADTKEDNQQQENEDGCLLYTSPSPRDQRGSRMPSSA